MKKKLLAFLVVIMCFIPSITYASQVSSSSFKDELSSFLDRDVTDEDVHNWSLMISSLKADGISAEVINIHTIKPLDEELVIASATKTGKVVTVEEHSVVGGLGSAVAEVLSEKAPTRMMRIGVNDQFGESGPALELIHKYGLDAEGIYKKVKAFCK